MGDRQRVRCCEYSDFTLEILQETVVQYQKQLWPTSQGSVPLEHEQPSWQLGGMVPQVSFGSPQRPVLPKTGGLCQGR